MPMIDKDYIYKNGEYYQIVFYLNYGKYISRFSQNTKITFVHHR